jgi:hypothetical protein
MDPPCPFNFQNSYPQLKAGPQLPTVGASPSLHPESHTGDGPGLTAYRRDIKPCAVAARNVSISKYNSHHGGPLIQKCVLHYLLALHFCIMHYHETFFPTANFGGI